MSSGFCDKFNDLYEKEYESLENSPLKYESHFRLLISFVRALRMLEKKSLKGIFENITVKNREVKTIPLSTFIKDLADVVYVPEIDIDYPYILAVNTIIKYNTEAIIFSSEKNGILPDLTGLTKVYLYGYHINKKNELERALSRVPIPVPLHVPVTRGGMLKTRKPRKKGSKKSKKKKSSKKKMGGKKKKKKE